MKKIQTLNKLLNYNLNKSFSKIRFKYKYLADNKEVEVEAEEDQNLLEIAHNNDIDLEGACEASLACSTCHIILDDNLYKNIPEATEEEEDLLDMAFGLSTTSRLGCQVKINKDFEGVTIIIPSATRNLYVDGSKPKKH